MRQYFGAFQASKVRLRTKNSLFAVKSEKLRVSSPFESKCNFDIGIEKNATFSIYDHLGLNSRHLKRVLETREHKNASSPEMQNERTCSENKRLMKK